MRAFIWMLAMLVHCGSALAVTWSLSDVSILLPLPNTEELPLLLRVDNIGDGGRLIPATVMKAIPRLTPTAQQGPDGGLRAIGFRIDPCFPSAEGFAPSCRRQIRIVWQPLVARGTGAVAALDAGVHSFYDLSPSEFSEFTAALAKLRGSSTSAALGVHPLALEQGLRGEFVTNLHRLLLRYAGAKRLTRVTFMLVRGNSIVWSFGGFEVGPEASLAAMAIPRLVAGDQGTRQTFFNQSAGDSYVRSDLAPAPIGRDTLNLLLRDSDEIDRPRDEAEIMASIQAAQRIETQNFTRPQPWIV